jgi:hypothetical protein
VIGKNVVVKTPNEFDSQVWFFDQKTKTIKNSLQDNKSLDIQNSGSTNNLQIWNTNGGWFQQFKFEQNYFKNVKDGRVIEIANQQDGEGNNVGLAKLTYQLCQKWQVDYVDTAEDRKTTGLYVPYQIHLGRAFIIRSRMPMQRVLTVTGGRNLVIKTHNRQDNNQIFFLDPETKTIKSVAQNTKSIDIQGSGGSSNLQIWNTNARWFLFKYDNGAIVNIKDGRAMDVSGNHDRDG